MTNFGTEDDWSDGKARAMLGRTVLVGITHVEADGETVIEHEQFFGRIISVSPEGGIELALKGDREGETKFLPPRLSAYERAEPGEYTLTSSGEVVLDPHFTSRWTVIRPTV